MTLERSDVKAYLIVGCPGSGKSWVAEQLKDKFDYVHHDAFIGMNGNAYLHEIFKRASVAKKPLLLETPFGVSYIKDALRARGIPVECVFIQEDDQVIKKRYEERDKKPIPTGHLTRQKTYMERANKYKAFHGSSSEVLEYLKGKV